jgi:HTH-type transcriptional regulator / antitoxin HigA
MEKYIVKPIKKRAEYKLALKKLNEVWEAEKNTKEGDLLEMLLLVIDDYEAKNFIFPKLDPIAAIKYKMAEEGLNQSDLIKYFGTKSRVSEVLNGKKPLTLKMIKNLHQQFNIPADVLIGG